MGTSLAQAERERPDVLTRTGENGTSMNTQFLFAPDDGSVDKDLPNYVYLHLVVLPIVLIAAIWPEKV